MSDYFLCLFLGKSRAAFSLTKRAGIPRNDKPPLCRLKEAFIITTVSKKYQYQ